MEVLSLVDLFIMWKIVITVMSSLAELSKFVQNLVLVAKGAKFFHISAGLFGLLCY